MTFEKEQALSILIIEDDHTERVALETMLSLSLLSFDNVESAETMATAIQALSETHYDAVVLDLDLPDSKGLDTLDRISKTFPDVAIVVYTGQYNEHDGLCSQGAQEYIVKGYMDIPVLTKSLCYAMERKQIEQKLSQTMDDLENANRRLQDIVRVVSNGLKASLCDVKVLVEGLQKDHVDKNSDESKKHIDLLCQRVGHMQRLIEGVLEYSKVGRE